MVLQLEASSSEFSLQAVILIVNQKHNLKFEHQLQRRSVLTALRNAMTIAGQAMILVAIGADDFDEARKLFLLARAQASGIDWGLPGRCLRIGRKRRTQKHDCQQR